MSFLHRAMGRIGRFPQQVMRQTMQRLLRLLFQLQGQRRRWARSGFVFPTTVLLLLVVALTASALTYRAYSRSGQAILERQQQVITNATTPAIDRAKAKLDYLLTQDDRSPRKVPTSDQMVAMLKATVTEPSLEVIAEPLEPDGRDLYTLPGEERLDIDGDGNADNAWYFTSDLNNDGTVADDEVVVYSILIDDNNNGVDINDDVSAAKAQALVTRNGPISTSEVTGACVTAGASGGQRSAEGWQIASGTTIEKNFQVDAFVANLNDVSRTASTLEFQQVRAAARSNKWGAWFRYDLTAYPGAAFNWNGAMHTQGSLAIDSQFQGYMISSTNSCLYDESASEITLGAADPTNNFTGQLVLGTVNGFNSQSGDPKLHVDNNSATPNQITINASRDSVDNGSAEVMDVMQDPVEVYLNDTTTHVDNSTWTTTGVHPNLDGRVRNIGAAELRSITLDDAFRADNRWGPKQVYDAEDPTDGRIPTGTDIGENIGSVPKLTNTTTGLDGYWERQAISLGTRMIVGERLELGNANGWNNDPTGGSADDALYPSDGLVPNTQTSPSTSGNYGYAEQKQRKALRDNLAAVQGMVIYRYDLNSGATPQACIAVTAHPGTLQTRVNSRTFRTRTDGADVMTDFLTGNGTNGWEFAPVTSGMSVPRQNLANFAGDPLGGAPAFEPTQDSNVHPYPYMSMWGDFSTLRRVLASGNGSPADQTYQDSADCTLGLLAYNLTAVKGEYDAITAANWQALATELTTAGAPALATSSYEAWQSAIATASYQPWVEAGYRYWELERDRAYGFATGLGLPNTTAAQAWGAGVYDPAAATYTTSAGTVGGVTNGVAAYAVTTSYDVTCDPNIFADATAYGITSEDDALSMALALCPKVTEVRYPALYYVFPVVTHDQNGGSMTIPSSTYGKVATAALTITADQPGGSTGEPYIFNTVETYSQNNTFTAVDYTTVAAVPKDADGGNWVLPPVSSTPGAALSPIWDDTNNNSEPDTEPFRLDVMGSDGTTLTRALDVLVLDKGLFEGRELLSVRLLDLDIGALATAGWLPGKDASDIEHNGLVYAYREDAVREDEIVRPINAGATSAACNSYDVLKAYDSLTSECYMTITGSALTDRDPPLAVHKISLKPIDYAPDPDRRPHGFRLRNGASLNRGSTEQSGITFITDNVVAIQGDFNLHRTGATDLEEFSDADKQIFKLVPTAGDFFAKFYARATLNLGDFANSSSDTWRPAEILADAISIYSAGFQDGFVEAAYANNAGGSGATTPFHSNSAGSGLVSYQNRNPFGFRTASTKLVVDASTILREGGGDTTAPIYFDRNGVAYNTSNDRLVQDDVETGSDYYYWGFAGLPDQWANQGSRKTRNDNLAPASGEITVNALLISGIVPPRVGQRYGGLHNFPHFTEFWVGEDVNIAGGFFQLFFSTSATAPYDQDAWEANQTSDVGTNLFEYYQAPNRVWGYDVALQYSPQSPIASRFTSVGDPRSEFYRELPVDDPYIKMLRCAEYAGPSGNVQIDPKAVCP